MKKLDEILIGSPHYKDSLSLQHLKYFSRLYERLKDKREEDINIVLNMQQTDHRTWAWDVYLNNEDEE